MEYLCAKCHHAFSGEDAHRCPNCGAEAGLEETHAVPPAMKYFGVLVAGVLAIALGGDLIGRLAG